MTRAAGLSLLALVLLTHCVSREQSSAHLIQLEAIEQSLEQPDRLIVHGAGLPQATRGTARLRGTLFPAGERPRAVDVTAPCRVEDPHEAEIDLQGTRFEDEVAGPFEGELTLSFGSSDDALLVGRLVGVTARLGGPESLARQLSLRTRAQAFQRALGLAEVQLGDQGVSIERLAPDGAAARAGLSVHDVVLRLSGRPVQLPLDLLLPTAHAAVDIEIARPSEGGARHILPVESQDESAPHVSAIIMLCFFLGAAFAVVFARAIPEGTFWSPRRREFWLSAASAASLIIVAALVLREAHWLLRLSACALATGAALSGGGVYLLRRTRRASHNVRDPNLAPFL